MGTSTKPTKRPLLWVQACWECGRDFLSHRCTAFLGSAKCRQRWNRKWKGRKWNAYGVGNRHPRSDRFPKPRPYHIGFIIADDNRHK